MARQQDTYSVFDDPELHGAGLNLHAVLGAERLTPGLRDSLGQSGVLPSAA